MKKKNILSEIELNNDVQSIKYKDFPLWLEIRNFFSNKIHLGKESILIINKQTYFLIIKSFFYGFFNWFKRYDVWMFNNVIDRVEIDNKWYDKYFDYPASIIDNALIIELPSHSHYKRKNIASKYIVSKSVLIIFEKMYSIFINPKKANLKVYDELAEKYNVNVNTTYVIKKMISQYKVMSFLLKFSKPKVAFVMPSYTSYGYIRAFKEKGIKVVELQHGVIVKKHTGYNLKAKFDRIYFVDNLLTFGLNEIDVFNSENYGIDKDKVIPIGNFYLDYMSRFTKKNIVIEELKKGYSKVMAVSLQDVDISDTLIDAIICIANKHDDWLFLMKPRQTPISVYQSKYNIPTNVYFVSELDIYQTIKYSDYHITVYSTCAIEAPALGVMNILYNVKNKSKEIFEEVLNNQQTTLYANTVSELENLIEVTKTCDKETVKEVHKSVIYSNYKKNMDTYINEQLDL